MLSARGLPLVMSELSVVLHPLFTRILYSPTR